MIKNYQAMVDHFSKILYFAIFTLTIFLVIIFNPVYASETTRYDTISITKSFQLDKVIFDGKWSFGTEWKASSLDTLTYDDGTNIILRTAHQDEFIYVHLDVTSDTTPARGSDNALVCIDGQNNKSKIPDTNDYCFSLSLLRNHVFTYQGGGSFGFNGNFVKISNPEGLIIISNITDQQNRYSKVTHSSYEFRIPLSIVEFSNTYGFYVSVFDSNKYKIYSWPYDVERKHLLYIPSPSLWGELVSPDNSIKKLS